MQTNQATQRQPSTNPNVNGISQIKASSTLLETNSIDVGVEGKVLSTRKENTDPGFSRRTKKKLVFRAYNSRLGKDFDKVEWKPVENFVVVQPWGTYGSITAKQILQQSKDFNKIPVTFNCM